MGARLACCSLSRPRIKTEPARCALRNFREFGGPQALRLEEVAEPQPGARRYPDQSDGGRPQLLRHAPAAQPVPGIAAASLLARERRSPAPSRASAPTSPISSLGRGWWPIIGGNGCREKVVTKANNAVPIPDGVSDEAAAAIPITYGTALHGLKDRGRLQAGRDRGGPWRRGRRGSRRRRDRQAHGGARHRRGLVGRQACLCPRAWRR